MIQFNEEDFSTEILRQLSLAGETTKRSLELLNRVHPEYLRRLLSNMRKEQYITMVGRNPNRSIRLAKKGLELLKEKYPDWYDIYMINSNNHKFERAHHLRTIRRNNISDLYCLFTSLGYRFLDTDRPTLRIHNKGPRFKIDDVYFYNSRELKNTDYRQRNKSSFTRIHGALVCQGEVYSIYNTNDKKMKWSQAGETKAKVLVEDVSRGTFDLDQKFQVNQAIMFGRDMDTVIKLLMEPESVHKPEEYEYFTFDNTYRSIKYVTLDHIGRIQMKMLTTPGYQDIIVDKITKRDNTNNMEIIKPQNVDADAYIKAKNSYLLFLYDGDIGRLKRFASAAEIKTNSNFLVSCFKEQEKIFRQYLGDRVKVVGVESEAILSYFEN